jgi:DNA-binding transcriptional ArsR family regulator
MDTALAVTSLAALAQPHRLAIFRRLVELGPDGAFAGELAEHLAIPPNTLSFHLKSLQQAGLIQPEPLGRNIRYRADFEAMRELVGFLSENCCGGDASLCEPTTAPAKSAGCG